MVESSIISNYSTIKWKPVCFCFFCVVSLFGQIDAEKLQNPLSKIIKRHRLDIFRKIGKHIVELNINRKIDIDKDKYIIECQ